MQSNNKETIKYALYNKEGKVLLPYNSDKLEILTNNLIRKNNKNGVYILNSCGTQISNTAYKKNRIKLFTNFKFSVLNMVTN